MKQMPTTWVAIDADALMYNVHVMRRLMKPDTKLMAVVKANAYGHGFIDAAKVFIKAGIDWLGVFTLDDALALRVAKIKKDILVMGPTDPGRFKEALKHNIVLTIQSEHYIRLIPKKLRVHVKIDTGLSRQGFLPHECEWVFSELLNRHIYIEGMYTHLAMPDAFTDTSFSEVQKSRFDEVIDMGRRAGIDSLLYHMVASDGLVSFPAGEYDMVRAGILLYGLPPSNEWEAKCHQLGLKAALSWKTHVSEIKTIAKGETVGYSRTIQVSRDTRIAILPIGYWDGFPRSMSSRGAVLIHGNRCKVLGRVAMNVTVVDVTDLNVVVGDEVTLIGQDAEENISAIEMANLDNSISYEIVTRINPLIPRIYTHGASSTTSKKSASRTTSSSFGG